MSGYAFLGNELPNAWFASRRIGTNEHFEESFSLLHLIVIIVAVAAHYGFRRLDRRDKRLSLWQSLCAWLGCLALSKFA